MRRIITAHNCPPVPSRQYDWSAISDGYEPGDSLGFGATEQEAISSLLEEEQHRRQQGIECACCEGSGRIEFGDYGSFYRDGAKYDFPGVSKCDACGGTGRVED